MPLPSINPAAKLFTLSVKVQSSAGQPWAIVTGNADRLTFNSDDSPARCQEQTSQSQEHTCNPITWKAEAGESQVQSLSGLLSETMPQGNLRGEEGMGGSPVVACLSRVNGAPGLVPGARASDGGS